MKRGQGFWIGLVVLLLVAQVVLAAQASTIVLSVEGMT